MSKKFNATSPAAAVSAVLCINAWAIEPQSVKLSDGLTFTPTLKVSERYDDNFRAVEDSEESSWITGITPTFVLGAEGRKSAYALTYLANSDIFHSSHTDDNTDHHLTADAGFEFDARNRLKLNTGYHKVEETTSEDQNIENDKYSTSNLGGVYTYGAESARTQVDFGAKYQELRYQNGNHLNADKERDTTALSSTFYYRVAPKTRALVEARHTEYDYVSNDRLNSNNVALLGGLTLDATAKTSGTVKIGGEKKRFDDSSIDDKSGGMWEVGVSWKPRTYSTFNLKTRRGLDEGQDNASAIESQSTTLSWKHEWLDRLSSDFSYTYSDKEYQDIKRDDKIDTFGLGLTYEMRRWLDVGVGYKYSENDSSAPNESFERNIYTLSLTASL
ncbi:outer membrane beta-barrel protein [Pseudomonas sp. R5(2019)]|uniref:outer membrane beta-barrel protein n=1 Tax=Pseudomonas sp. R5(2019) TaxID=2697566 RepID=UPI001411BA72|nr:outer membrane beta-barrel protein [Pseudomonas sp. R5(2019)]NBA96529.1 outer membrane beta-barrel protein [Pseudomonas sp. R5(2019)]